MNLVSTINNCLPLQVRAELLNPSRISYKEEDFAFNMADIVYDPISQTSNMPLAVSANTKTSPTTTTMFGADHDDYTDIDYN